METATYAVEARVEQDHWWFVGRRRLFAREIARMGLPSSARILDVGSSTGTNLRMFRALGFTDVTGLDCSADAIRFCEEKALGPVLLGDARALPFPDASLDLVLATDILEHLDDDRLGMREIRRVLAPGGRALVTVPAFESLWGLQDEVAQHRRRYRMQPLLARLRQEGLRPVRDYHFNFILFGPIWLARQIIRWLGLQLESENQVNTPLVNRILTGLFEVDVWLAPHLAPPFGVSILAVAEKAAP